MKREYLFFLADAENFCIRKMSVDGIVSRFAGSSFGYADGDEVSAKFAGIAGLGIDAQGNIFVADINNNRIR